MFFLGPLGLPELLIIVLIVVIIFGARRIPELGKGLGEGIRNFKRGLGGKEPEDKKSNSDKQGPPSKE